MDLAYQYPFMEAARELVAKLELDPVTSFKTSIQQRVAAIIELCLTGKALNMEPLAPGSGLLVAHVWLRLVLAFINNPALIYKVATNLSKEYEKLMSRESVVALMAIAGDQGLHVEAPDAGTWLNHYDYRVPFTDYLHLSTRFKSPSWRLINRPLSGGFVYLTKHDLVRMLVEAVNVHITSSLDMVRKPEIIELRKAFVTEFGGYIDVIAAKTAVKAMGTPSMLDDDKITLDPTCFPPCVVHVLQRIKEGINLTHYERLFLVSFCTFVGMDAGGIAGLFRGQPDFNAELTEKQVASIIGTAGQRTRYKPANCARLEGVHMCFKNEVQTCNNEARPVRNPMVAYKRKLYAKTAPPKPQVASKPARKRRTDDDA